MRDPRLGHDDTSADLGRQLLVALLSALMTDPLALEQLRELLDPGPGETREAQPAYTADSLARAIGVTPKVVRNAIARGELAAVKRGRRWLVSADAVDAWTRSDGRNSRVRAATRGRGAAGPLGTALACLDDDVAGRRIAGP